MKIQKWMKPNQWTIPLNKQIVGNVGLFYACYSLSRLGWNVMLTSRNARGIDIVIYSQDATRTHTIQVKTLSGLTPVPLGRSLAGLVGDFLIVCRNSIFTPECFIFTMPEVHDLAYQSRNGVKPNYWFLPNHGSHDSHYGWEKIGYGATPINTANGPRA